TGDGGAVAEEDVEVRARGGHGWLRTARWCGGLLLPPLAGEGRDGGAGRKATRAQARLDVTRGPFAVDQAREAAVGVGVPQLCRQAVRADVVVAVQRGEADQRGGNAHGGE